MGSESDWWEDADSGDGSGSAKWTAGARTAGVGEVSGSSCADSDSVVKGSLAMEGEAEMPLPPG